LTLLRIGKELGIDPDVILATSHGRRSIDVLEVLDPSKANWDCKLNLLLEVHN
jgi:glycerol 3-phosphatase-1